MTEQLYCINRKMSRNNKDTHAATRVTNFEVERESRNSLLDAPPETQKQNNQSNNTRRGFSS